MTMCDNVYGDNYYHHQHPSAKLQELKLYHTFDFQFVHKHVTAKIYS